MFYKRYKFATSFLYKMPMIVLKDMVNKHEVLSKAYVDKEDDLFYIVKGKMILPDVEDGAEDVVKVVDIPYKFGLDPIDDCPKAVVASAMKTVMKAVLKSPKFKALPEDKVNDWKKLAAGWVDNLIKKTFDDYVYYIHGNVEEFDKAYIIFCKWEGETPWFYFLKDALIEEKV